jgi:hypothetical protein
MISIFYYSSTKNNYNFNTKNKLNITEYSGKNYIGEAIYGYVKPEFIELFDYILIYKY